MHRSVHQIHHSNPKIPSPQQRTNKRTLEPETVSRPKIPQSSFVPPTNHKLVLLKATNSFSPHIKSSLVSCSASFCPRRLLAYEKDRLKIVRSIHIPIDPVYPESSRKKPRRAASSRRVRGRSVVARALLAFEFSKPSDTLNFDRKEESQSVIWVRMARRQRKGMIVRPTFHAGHR